MKYLSPVANMSLHLALEEKFSDLLEMFCDVVTLRFVGLSCLALANMLTLFSK